MGPDWQIRPAHGSFFFGTGLGRSQVLFQNVMERTYAGDPDSLEVFFFFKWDLSNINGDIDHEILR